MTADTVSRKVLRFDAGFLLLAGGAAMIIETVGHFLGRLSAQTKGSVSTIDGFETRGLAMILAVLIRAARLSERFLWFYSRALTGGTTSGSNDFSPLNR